MSRPFQIYQISRGAIGALEQAEGVGGAAGFVGVFRMEFGDDFLTVSADGVQTCGEFPGYLFARFAAFDQGEHLGLAPAEDGVVGGGAHRLIYSGGGIYYDAFGGEVGCQRLVDAQGVMYLVGIVMVKIAHLMKHIDVADFQSGLKAEMAAPLPGDMAEVVVEAHVRLSRHRPSG